MPSHALLRRMIICLMFSCFFLALSSIIQATEPDPAPERESDPRVLQKLEWFQDQKFGLLMHWGIYSVWGIVESWSICPEDENWTIRRGPYKDDYNAYVKEYEKLQTVFNPTEFDPETWAKAAKEAGMRYVVFTTKHHDGFCMFDTKETDYKVTDPACPFSANSKANITKEIFDAFRAEGFGVGAYFSKADWHCPDYWWPYFPPFDRNVNYDITRYPEKWEAFKTFTQNQIMELMTDYGSVDILWLDGGWVQPMTETSPRWGKSPCDQNIDMPKIAAMAREKQPGLIIVDRAVEGRYQNYRTPEQHVPDTALDYVWETCMTMATSWSFVKNDEYKPTPQLIHLLVDIVCKGGNFLLNIGPGPDGTLAPDAWNRLKEIGEWMKVNGPAIYETRAVAPYKKGNVCFTKMRDGSINAIYLPADSAASLPEEISIPSFTPQDGSDVIMLGINEKMTWEKSGNGCIIHVPESIRNNPPCKYAWAFHFLPE
ncbi:MAG: alpha-L-fucosidase [Candidatus Zixiibacteriota bacterium]